MIWTRAIYGPSCILVSSGVDMPGGQDQMNFTACCRGTLYCCTCENEVEFDIKVFRSLRLVLDVKEFMELPVWQLGAMVSENQAWLCRRVKFLFSAAINGNTVSCQGRTGDSAWRLCDRTQHLLLRAALPSAVVPNHLFCWPLSWFY